MMKFWGCELVIFALYIKHVENGYFFGSSSLSWESASTDCESRGKRLVCLKNEASYNSAVFYLQNTIGSLNTDVWIGLRTYSSTDPFIYYWMDNETAAFFEWNSSVDEPNDQQSDLCIRLYKNQLTMGTWLCNDQKQYLCEDAPINGGWSIWSTVSDCSVTCGNGSQSRARSCDSPYPSGGGADCTGSSSEDQTCTVGDCSVDGFWSVWMEWSNCIQVQCGVSNRTRYRSCDSPPPAGGGSYCVGAAAETEGCVNSTCPSGEQWTCAIFQDVSPDTLQEKIEEITKTLTINKTTLSSTVRKKTCAEDPRPSSTYIGVVAILFIGIYFGLLLLVDCISFLKWFVRKCKFILLKANVQ